MAGMPGTPDNYVKPSPASLPAFNLTKDWKIGEGQDLLAA
jgi:hypothetical protein